MLFVKLEPLNTQNKPKIQKIQKRHLNGAFFELSPYFANFFTPHQPNKKQVFFIFPFWVVGATRFELATSRPPDVRATPAPSPDL